MSLQVAVFWTKRVLVILIIILFICGGIRIFQFISDRLSVKREVIGLPKPEAGFGKLPKLHINGINKDNSIKPSKFRISTISGLLDIENGYPKHDTPYPIVNVFKVEENPIDISTTEDPIKIARAMEFTTSPKEISQLVKEWNEGERKLVVEGQYKTINYRNASLKQKASNNKPTPTPTSDRQKANIDGRVIFQNIINSLKLPIKMQNYRYKITYLKYDQTQDKFLPNIDEYSTFIRVDAFRTYPNLFKEQKPISTSAAYPNYNQSVNYVLLINDPNSLYSDKTKILNSLVELSIYDWPLNTTVSDKNPNIQTYPIINASRAYEILSENKGILVSVMDNLTKNDEDPINLKGIDVIDILTIRLEYYEDTEFRRYITPVYVFITEAQRGNRKYQLVYYVPALSDEYLLD